MPTITNVVDRSADAVGMTEADTPRRRADDELPRHLRLRSRIPAEFLDEIEPIVAQRVDDELAAHLPRPA